MYKLIKTKTFSQIKEKTVNKLETNDQNINDRSQWRETIKQQYGSKFRDSRFEGIPEDWEKKKNAERDIRGHLEEGGRTVDHYRDASRVDARNEREGRRGRQSHHRDVEELVVRLKILMMMMMKKYMLTGVDSRPDW